MPSAYKLPVAGRFEAGGCHFVVRALPWSIARRVAASADKLKKDDTDAIADIAADCWSRCVETEDGSPPPAVEDVSQADVMRAFNLALGGTEGEGPDFPPPPTGDGSGG